MSARSGNYWTSLDRFPGFETQPYYLHAGGVLSTTPPSASEGADSYIYDPANPVPSMGGNNLEVQHLTLIYIHAEMSSQLTPGTLHYALWITA